MDISSSASAALLTAPATSSPSELRENIALKMLKTSLEFEGQLALSLLPSAPADPDSPIGQHIDVRA